MQLVLATILRKFEFRLSPKGLQAPTSNCCVDDREYSAGLIFRPKNAFVTVHERLR